MNLTIVMAALSMLHAPPAIVASRARSKFPVSASCKVLGCGPLWVADKKEVFNAKD